MYQVYVVENSVQAREKIEQLTSEGFTKDHIYLFSHNKEFSKDLTDATDTSPIGIGEQGFFESVGNLFKKRGDELRSKLQSLGLSEIEALQYEKDLDEHKIVIVTSDQASDIDNTKIM